MAERFTRITAGLNKARIEGALARHSFAPFVSDNRVTNLDQTVPVFCFHSVRAPAFESILIYLKNNRYRTLTADDLVACLRGDRPADNGVVLSFDDGWRSTWTVAYPLLKKHGFCGVSFVVPSWIGDNDPSPNLEDHWSGRMTLEHIHELERVRPYLSWSEAKAMQSDGAFEFQSHSLTHDTVFTSGEIVDFVNPIHHHAPHKIPIVGDSSLDPWNRSAALGMPLYTVAPRLTGAQRYLDDAKLRTRCIEWVRQNGGERFFEAADWRDKLFKLTNATRDTGSFETPEQRDDAIRCELRESKQVIEQKLGNAVRHFCFPFYAGSEIALKISAELGYVANYWGWRPVSGRRADHYGRSHLYAALDETDYSTGDALQGRRANTVGDDPFRIVRLPGDYVHRLPGSGRRSLSSMFVRKCVRAARSWT